MRRISAKKSSALLSTVAVSTTLATGALHVAPPADATCISVFGLNNGNGCVSNTTSIAIAIGPGAVADASSAFFGTALAFGAGAHATTALSAFTNVVAWGVNATASTMFSILSWVLQTGPGDAMAVGGPNFVFNITSGGGQQTAGAVGIGNLVTQFGPGASNAIGLANLIFGFTPWGDGNQRTESGLVGSVALNLFGNSYAAAQGFFNLVVDIFNYRLWPFEPFVQIIRGIEWVVTSILRFFGILPPLPQPESSGAVVTDPEADPAAEALDDTGEHPNPLNARIAGPSDGEQAAIVDVSLTEPGQTVTEPVTEPEPEPDPSDTEPVDPTVAQQTAPGAAGQDAAPQDGSLEDVEAPAEDGSGSDGDDTASAARERSVLSVRGGATKVGAAGAARFAERVGAAIGAKAQDRNAGGPGADGATD